jgi:hypothetical protein
MAELVDRPGLLLIVSFAGFLLAALLGVVAQRVWRPVQAGDQNELTIVQTAALTLLGLIVGFSFSMAVTRYDQRKNLEEAEANAVSGRPFCLLACAIPLSHCLLCVPRRRPGGARTVARSSSRCWSRHG